MLFQTLGFFPILTLLQGVKLPAPSVNASASLSLLPTGGPGPLMKDPEAHVCPLLTCRAVSISYVQVHAPVGSIPPGTEKDSLLFFSTIVTQHAF